MSKKAIIWTVVVIVVIIAIYYGYKWYQKKQLSDKVVPAAQVNTTATPVAAETSVSARGTKTLPTYKATKVGGIIPGAPIGTDILVCSGGSPWIYNGGVWTAAGSHGAYAGVCAALNVF